MNPVPSNWQDQKKQKGSRISDLSFFRLQNEFRKVPLLVMYYLTKFDAVIGSCFWVIPKIKSVNLCKSVYSIINYSTFICPFVSGKCWRKGKKITKTRISKERKELRERKELFRWNKKHLSLKTNFVFVIAFEGLSLGEKIKMADESFKLTTSIQIDCNSQIFVFAILFVVC